MKQYSRKKSFEAQHGFTLIEVLVSIVVLTFGLLGMVGMQVSAMQANRDARLQSSAVRFGREIAELMRDNKDIAIQPTAATNPYLTSFTATTSIPALTAPSTANNCFLSACANKNFIATWGVWDWRERVRAELPGATVAICYDETPYDAAGLPQWPCSNTGNVAIVKIGWTRASTNRAALGAAIFDKAVLPSVILPVVAGVGV